MQNKRLASLLNVTTSFTLLMLSGMFGASRANAVSINYSSPGVATGINSLDVNGQKYDVDFVYGTFADVFGNPMQSGWTPPNFSGFTPNSSRQPNISSTTIQNAVNAVTNQLNAGSSNQVADANSGTQKNYFITGGLVDDVADTVQVFYGELNNQGQWISQNTTCNYGSGFSNVSPQCIQTLVSFGVNLNPSNPPSLSNLFTQPQVMFAKYNTESVPEPITILGTIVAGGIGVAIKKKQKNKTAA